MNIFVKKYHNLASPVKASLWFLVCGFLQKGISMLTTPLFTRVMTEAEYGRYSAYSSWLSIIQIIVSLNLAAGVYTRGLVKNEQDQDRFSSSMLGLSTTCILIWTVIYFCLHNFINQLLNLSTVLMVAMLVEIWASAAYQFWSNRERVNYRYKKLVALTLVYVSIRPLLGVAAIFHADVHHQVEARVISAAAVNLAIFSFLYIAVTRKGKQFFSKQYWLYALKFNIPLVPHYLSQIVLNQSDRLMINGICGASQTAYYSVAYTLASALQILNTSIAGTMNPWIYQSLKKGKSQQIGKYSYYILILIAASNFLVITIAPEIMRLLAPRSYSAALWVIPPVTASVYFMFLYNLFATFEYYFEETRWVMYASVAGAALNIILNYIFINKFGFLAAGYTTLVCYILYAFVHYFFMKKVCDKYMGGISIYNVRIIIMIGLVLIVCSMLMMLLYNYCVLRYIILCSMVGVAAINRKKIKTIFATLKEK